MKDNRAATEMLLDLEEVSSNPNAAFDYSYVVDRQPTKYVRNDELVNDSNETYDEDAVLDKKE